MYSWCKTRESGQTIVNPRTDRIRTLVVESGKQGQGRWNDYVRDDLTHEYPVCFGPWSDAFLDGAELHKWVYDLANGLCTRPMIHEADVLELLASSDSEHREIALRLMGAKSYQRQTP